MRGSRTLSDAGLAAQLRPLAPTLVTLCLSGCTLVGDATYIALGGGVGSGAAPRLRELDLSCGGARLAPRAAAMAAALAVDAASTGGGDDEAPGLPRLPPLRRLELSDNPGATLPALRLLGGREGRHDELLELGADGCGLGDAECASLLSRGGLPRLRVLSLADSQARRCPPHHMHMHSWYGHLPT